MNITVELKRLKGLTVAQLRAEFERVWREPTRSNNKAFLIKRVAWRLQAAEQGDLSDRARRRAEELAVDLDLRVRPNGEVHRAYREVVDAPAPSLPPAGSVIQRKYKGRLLEVTLLEHGVRFEGREFSSLSAVAQHITGAVWSGRRFFGLTTAKTAKEAS